LRERRFRDPQCWKVGNVNPPVLGMLTSITHKYLALQVQAWCPGNGAGEHGTVNWRRFRMTWMISWGTRRCGVAGKELVVTCTDCFSSSFRLSHFRLSDLGRLAMLQYPVRCRLRQARLRLLDTGAGALLYAAREAESEHDDLRQVCRGVQSSVDRSITGGAARINDEAPNDVYAGLNDRARRRFELI
jgi:hypothetical protein